MQKNKQNLFSKPTLKTYFCSSPGILLASSLARVGLPPWTPLGPRSSKMGRKSRSVCLATLLRGASCIQDCSSHCQDRPNIVQGGSQVTKCVPCHTFEKHKLQTRWLKSWPRSTQDRPRWVASHDGLPPGLPLDSPMDSSWARLELILASLGIFCLLIQKMQKNKQNLFSKPILKTYFCSSRGGVQGGVLGSS